MASNFLYWAAPDDTDSDDTFNIYTDYGGTPGVLTTLLTTKNSVNRGDGQYSSYATTLALAIDKVAVSLELASGTNFADADKVFFKKEGPLILGGKSGNVFNAVTRGPVPVAHIVGDGVYKAHMSHEHTSVDWGSRFAMRYLIRPVIDTIERVGALVVVYNPPDPPNDAFTTTYGLTERSTAGDETSYILAGEQVTLEIEDEDNYLPLTGSPLVRRKASVVSDADGFWRLFLPRRPRQEGGDTYLLTLCANKSTLEGFQQWRISNVPDKDHCHFLEIAEPV